jgi:hypothetical protein
MDTVRITGIEITDSGVLSLINWVLSYFFYELEQAIKLRTKFTSTYKNLTAAVLQERCHQRYQFSEIYIIIFHILEIDQINTVHYGKH